MSLTIEIRDSENNVEGVLDIGKDDSFPFSLTKRLASIKEISKRGGVFSKSFKIPATKDNNKLLENLYSANQKPVKGMREKKTALILVDDVIIERGYTKVIDVSTKNGTRVYELQFFGNNVTWMTELNNTTLNELAFRNNAQTYSQPKIELNWASGFDGGDDHVYPLISYGQYKEPGKIIVRDLRPAIYYRAIVERALNKVGYKLESEFMDTTAFKKLIFPYVGDRFRKSVELMESKKFRATPVATPEPFYGQEIPFVAAGLDPPTKVIFDDDSSLFGYVDAQQNFDNSGNYSTINSSYEALEKGSYRFSVLVKGRVASNTGLAGVYLFKNGAELALIETIITFSPTGFTKFRTPIDTGFFVLEQNDKIDVRVLFSGSGGGSMILDTRSHWQLTEMDKELFDSNTYNLSDVVPEVSVLDLFTDLTRLFNLHWVTDNKTNVVTVEDRDNFFKGVDEAVDYSDKIDIGSEYSLNFISDYKKEVEFKYKIDAKDKYLEARNDTFTYTNDLYCSYLHVLPDRFQKGRTIVETRQLSPTYVIIDINSTSESFAPITARMWNKANNDGSPPDAFYDFNPRILNFNHRQQNFDGNERSFNWEGTQRANIPEALPIKVVKMQFDGLSLSFAQPDGLWNTHYNRTFSIIEDGIRLKAKFNISSTDYQSLDMRKPIYIAFPEELHGYWIIDTIKDYSPLKPLTTMELMRYRNQDVLFQPLPVDLNYGLNPYDTPDGGVDSGIDIDAGMEVGGFSSDDAQATSLQQQGMVISDGSGGIVADGSGSLVMGTFNEALGQQQTVMGKYADINTTDILRIGAGTSDTDRVTAMRIDEDGNASFYGGEIYIIDSNGSKIPVTIESETDGDTQKSRTLYLSE